MIKMNDSEDIFNECNDFVRGKYSKNTGYCNNTSHNFFRRFFISRGESRKVEEKPPQELNCHVQTFRI